MTQSDESVNSTDAAACTTTWPPADRDLAVLLSKALRLAGEAGRPVAAGRLGGKAWWALRESDPKGAERINGVMHYLAKLPDEAVDAESTTQANGAG